MKITIIEEDPTELDVTIVIKQEDDKTIVKIKIEEEDKGNVLIDVADKVTAFVVTK